MMKNRSDYLEELGSGFNPVPSLFTLCNALCGFSSIIYTLSAGNIGEPIPAISLLLIGGAMVFDVLDGLAARVLKAGSLHGMNLDSLADAISFGAAPAVMVYSAGMSTAPSAGMIHTLSWLAASFYLGCVLWRLAQFNTQSADEKSDHGDFVGLPSPGAAAVICSMVVAIPALGLGERASFILYMAYPIVSAILMVSAVPYMHICRILSRDNKWVGIGVLVAVATSFILLKMWVFVVWAHLYLLYAPLWTLESRLVQHMHKVRAVGVSPDDEL